MRRSEMCKKLEELLKLDNINLFYYEVSSIIERIEELGMLPPYNPIGSEPIEGHIMYCQWDRDSEVSENDYLADKEYYNRYGYPDDKKEE